jgi:hypothetical protein
VIYTESGLVHFFLDQFETLRMFLEVLVSSQSEAEHFELHKVDKSTN